MALAFFKRALPLLVSPMELGAIIGHSRLAELLYSVSSAAPFWLKWQASPKACCLLGNPIVRSWRRVRIKTPTLTYLLLSGPPCLPLAGGSLALFITLFGGPSYYLAPDGCYHITLSLLLFLSIGFPSALLWS